MKLRFQPVSATIKPWMPPRTTPAMLVATKAPEAPTPRTNQP
jgi:hypothetical protein